jgi:predicted ATP-grasp superfamily ATP-dependent carboligase
MAHWYGTLAAVRELGRRGIEVYVAESGGLQQASWSRYAARRLSCPDERTVHYVEWLLNGGHRPGTVLCRTSDNVAFVHAERHRELAAHFLLATPELPVFREILDKARLHQQAMRVGLRTPRSVYPADAAEAQEFASTLSWPLLIKQRTQVGSRTLHKGTPVPELKALAATYASFRERNRFEPGVLARWPDVDRPMLQEYLPQCSTDIYCLAGFISPDGKHWATRAAHKVLSHPRHLGIGLLFEHVEVDPVLEDRVLRLCRAVGYHGIFQCEFLESKGEHLLIDFNPRFYNYMAFDEARGLPQAYLAYLLAIGAHDELRIELARARSTAPDVQGMIYNDRVGTWTQLSLEHLFHRIPRDERARWKAWRKRAKATVDPVWAGDDIGPGMLDLLRRLWEMGRHPRSFFRGNTSKAL